MPTFLALFLVPAAVALADELYIGEAVLEDDQRITDQALMQALDEVLVRLTGQIAPAPVDALEIGVQELESLLQSQQLVRRERIDPDGESDTELRVRAEFDEPAINRLLRENEFARWGRERPPVLLWLAAEDADGPRLIDDPYLEWLISENARRLGLDIVRPLGDALDMAEVTLTDIRGGFLDASDAAAERYGAGVIAMLDLRLEEESDEENGQSLWSGRWSWRIHRYESRLLHSGRAEEIVAGGMNRVASALAARYAVRVGAGEAGLRRVSVEGIVDDVQFSEVRGYLENLSLVDDLRVIGATGRTIEFELEVSSSGLEEFLEMGGMLTPAPAPGATDDELHYRLRR